MQTKRGVPAASFPKVLKALTAPVVIEAAVVLQRIAQRRSFANDARCRRGFATVSPTTQVMAPGIGGRTPNRRSHSVIRLPWPRDPVVPVVVADTPISKLGLHREAVVHRRTTMVAKRRHRRSLVEVDLTTTKARSLSVITEAAKMRGQWTYTPAARMCAHS